MKTRKLLEDYLRTDYTVVIMHGEVGYEAWHPEFGALTAMGVCNTPAEALQELDAMRKSAIKEFYAEDLDIPEPAADGRDYSGQLVLRMPKNLHGTLALSAKLNGVSLNQYLVSLLSERQQNGQMQRSLAELREQNRYLEEQISELARQIRQVTLVRKSPSKKSAPATSGKRCSNKPKPADSRKHPVKKQAASPSRVLPAAQ